MRFVYGKQDLRTLQRCREQSFLLTNGLGGYASVTGAYSVPRCDQGLLVAAVKAPNERITMVHRMREVLKLGNREAVLSTQEFADGTAPESGFRHLSRLVYEYLPVWTYHVSGVEVERKLCIVFERNTAVLRYTLRNLTEEPCALTLEPFFKFAPKEQALKELFELD